MDMAPPDPEDATARETGDAARMVRHQARLERLTEVGMEMVEALRAEMIAARDQGEPTAAADAARSFRHLERAVRQSIALDARLMREARLGRVEAERDRWRDEARLGRRARKEEARELLQDMIEHHTGDSRGRESLARRLHQRLDREDDRDTALFALDAPLGPAIGRLCYELGVRPDWTACDGEPWAPEAFDAYQALARERPQEVNILHFAPDENGESKPPTRVIFGPRRPSG